MKLFHRTEVKNLKSILAGGLCPSSIGIVYLSPRDDLVQFGDALLEVETGDCLLTAFDDCNKWEVLCWGPIAPQNIQVIDK
jgi:hypothetical protein